MDSPEVGRPRDASLDARIVDAARELMATNGIEAISFAAVAERAGTTRPAIYRRYPDRTSLAVAATASLAASTVPEPTGDLRADLARELISFRSGLTKLNGLGMVGAVLSGSTDPAITDTYRATVVAPRRSRIAAIIAAGVDAGELDADPASQKILVAMCTGSWYGFALAGETPPQDWPERTTALIWSAGRINRHR